MLSSNESSALLSLILKSKCQKKNSFSSTFSTMLIDEDDYGFLIYESYNYLCFSAPDRFLSLFFPPILEMSCTRT